MKLILNEIVSKSRFLVLGGAGMSKESIGQQMVKAMKVKLAKILT
tara:strand:- start:87 stop:221 length:135 start_codon:yes stop_codon:yes gene_type:complete